MRFSEKNNSGFMFVFITCCLLIVTAKMSTASDDFQAFVAVEQGTKTSVVRGEKLSFYIKLFSKTMFSGSPRFELPSMNNGLLYKVQDRPVLGTEKVKGLDYATQLHEFWFFPKVSGKLIIPEVNVFFSTPSMEGGGEQQHNMKTGPLTVTIAPLPGVPEEIAIIVTDDFTIEQNWRPVIQNGVVGDAVIRTITMQAKNTASIFLPDIDIGKMTGVSVYQDPAEVDDKNERGEASAQRKDSITYLFEAEGKYTLDPVSVRWWDSGDQKLQEEILEGLTIVISANPHMSAPLPGAGGFENSKAGSFKIILACLGFAGLIFAVLFLNIKKIVRQYQLFKNQPKQVEKALFKKLSQACHQNNGIDAYNLFNQWGMHTHGPDFNASILVQKDRQSEFSQEMTKLNNLLFRTKDTSAEFSWKGGRFLKVLRKVRKSTIGRSNRSKTKCLGCPINY